MSDRGTPLARLRTAHGWSLVEVAAAAGCTLRTARRVERLDVAGLKLATLVRVAHAVGVAPATLVPGLAADPPRPARLLADRSHLEGSSSRG